MEHCYEINGDRIDISINSFCKSWNPNAVDSLIRRQRKGEYIIFPSSKQPCRSCQATNRFVFSFGINSAGIFQCMRTCTFCGDTSSFRKLRVYFDNTIGECPQDG